MPDPTVVTPTPVVPGTSTPPIEDVSGGTPPALPVNEEDSGTSPPAETPPDQGSEPTPEQKRDAEKRIAQLTAKRKDAEREAAYWKGVAEGRGGGGQPPQSQPQAPRAVAPPDPRTFEGGIYDPLYIEAHDLYLIERGKREFQQEQERMGVVTKAREVHESFIAKMAKESESDPTLQDAMEDPTFFPHTLPPQAGRIVAAIKESDVAPDIIRHYYNNREELDKLLRKDPFSAIRDIGRLESELARGKPTTPTRKVSQAPEPVVPVAGNTPATSIPDDDDNLSTEEFIKRRNQKQYVARGNKR